MSLEIDLQGVDLLQQVGARIRANGRKDIGQQLGRALAAASKDLEGEIRDEYKALPTQGGYAGLMSRSLKFRTSRRGARVTLATYADGTKQRRDIQALEGGSLRHPVYGRSRKIKRGKKAGSSQPNPWAVTRIKGGYHERGTAKAADLARDQVVKVVEDFAAKLID